MHTLWQRLTVGSVALGMLVLAGSPTWAFTGKGVGLVTTLQGRATVAHATAPTTAAPLKFREDVFLQDVINTEAAALARILLRGSSLLTIRELSRVTITEEALPSGPKSVVSLLTGKLRATVSRALLGAGEQTEIRTPDAIASVRGTDVIILREQDTTTVGVLEGSAEVTNVPPQRGQNREEPRYLVDLFRPKPAEAPTLLAQAGSGGPLPILTAQAPFGLPVLVGAGQFTQIIAGGPPTLPAPITPAMLGILVGGLQGSGRGHGSQGPGSGATTTLQNQAAQAVSPVGGAPGVGGLALGVPSGGSPTSTATTGSQVISTTSTPLVVQDVNISGTFNQTASALFSQTGSYEYGCMTCTVTGTISSGTRTGVRPGEFTGTFSSTNTYTSGQDILSNQPATITSSGKVSGLRSSNLTGNITINFTVSGGGTYTHTGNATIKPDGTLNATYSGDIKDSSGTNIGTTTNGKMDQTPK